MSASQEQTVEIRGEMIRLGQLLKFADVAESGAQAGAIIADGDVSVDGETEIRRGRQVEPGSLVEIRLPHAAIALRVVSADPQA